MTAPSRQHLAGRCSRHLEGLYSAFWFERHPVLDPKLLNILVCPVSKAPLVYDEEKQELLCKASGLAYPVRDGIPVMLEEEARTLTTDEKLD